MIYVPMAWRDENPALPAQVHLVAEINAIKTISGDYRIRTRIEDYPRYSFSGVDYYRHVINKRYGFHLLVVHNGYYDAYPSAYEVRLALDRNMSQMVYLLQAQRGKKERASLTALSIGSGGVNTGRNSEKSISQESEDFLTNGGKW